MNDQGERFWDEERGFSLIELLVVVVVFVVMVLAIDAVFTTVNRSSRTAELAADVAQNGRVAMERLTREVRFSRPQQSEIRPWPFVPGPWIAFRSARVESPTAMVFCLDVNTASETPNAACIPPALGYKGSYAPVWQDWIVYCWSSNVLRRDVQSAVAPDQGLCQTSGDIIARPVASFNVSLLGSVLTVTLELDTSTLEASERIVQGADVPRQRITLTSRIIIRN